MIIETITEITIKMTTEITAMTKLEVDLKKKIAYMMIEK